MPSNCCIEFDRRDGIYGSGEMLNGKIILRSDNSKTIRGKFYYSLMSFDLYSINSLLINNKYGHFEIFNIKISI